MPDFAGTRGGLPRVVTLDTCDFPLVESEVDGYKVLELPQGLRDRFNDGADVIRIRSLELAATIPDYGGTSTGNFCFLPHQDHFGNREDPRQYLMLSKRADGARGSATLVMMPDVALRMLPYEERYFSDWRKAIGEERSYDRLFSITEDQYHRCFDTKEGYEEVVREMLGPDASPEREAGVRLNILNYLVRGGHADVLLGKLMRRIGYATGAEYWDQGGILIVRNPNVYHARDGGNNPPLQRNFCI